MSRRDSRASIGARHTDALVEFENLKKKFLLANKHITKLNSTLSVRIEELNAEISGLHAENLRLRASEISLGGQLKREREKSRRVMADAEAATLNLTKHLGYLRQSFNIGPEATPPLSPTSPRAHKPLPYQLASNCIPGLRISKPPNVPGIYEEEEPCLTNSDSDKLGSTKRKSKSKSRLSASKHPLPSRATTTTIASPPTTVVAAVTTVSRPATIPVSPPRLDLASALASSTKRKNSRRQSGLLSIDTENLAVPRPASPAFGSPIRLEAGRAEEEEEIAMIAGNLEIDVDAEQDPGHDLQDLEPPPPLPPKKEKRKSKTKEWEGEGMEKKGQQSPFMGVIRSKEKKRQRDEEEEFPLEGTKAKLRDVTNSRAVLQPIDPNTVHGQEELVVSTRTFLVQPADPSISNQPPELEATLTGGRERRVRKSVNYAEPKLNTKMRKPDPPPGTELPRTKKRSSAAAALGTTMTTTMEHPRAPGEPGGGESEPGARSSGEFLPRDAQGNIINPELYPLPPPKSQSIMYSSPLPPSRTSGTSSSSSSSSGANGTVKRKKSKPIVESDGEDSGGTQADGEYIPGGRLSGWVNVEGRRKTGERVKKSSIVMLGETRREFVDERRHSMAI